jgi:hypothetical protein
VVHQNLEDEKNSLEFVEASESVRVSWMISSEQNYLNG